MSLVYVSKIPVAFHNRQVSFVLENKAHFTINFVCKYIINNKTHEFVCAFRDL